MNITQPIILDGGRANISLSAMAANSELVAEIERRAVPLILDSDQLLFSTGDRPQALFLLKSGALDLSVEPADGVAISVSSSDTIVGLAALLSEQLYSLCAKARADSKVFRLSASAFRRLMSEDPGLSFAIAKTVATEMRWALDALSKAHCS